MSEKRACVDILARKRNGERIKKWRRTWTLELIERHNRQWRDLYEELA